MTLSQLALEPAFDFSSSGTAVLLNSNSAELIIDGKKYVGPGRAELVLLPSARIALVGEFNNLESGHLSGVLNRDALKFHFGGQEVPGFCVATDGSMLSRCLRVTWAPSSEPVQCIGSETTKIQYVIFHLFNFVEFVGTSPRLSATAGHDQISMKDGEVEVLLASTSSSKDNFKTLNAEGGYQLTQVGRVRREDSKHFTGKEAQEYLDALRYFLSFAKGNWCMPVCAVGFNSNDVRVWESWSSPIEIWDRPVSWFDPHNVDELVDLFPGFMAKWRDPSWSDAIQEGIYWYLASNQDYRGIDGNIVLAQAAFERLSYERLVKPKGALTKTKYGNLNAADKIRELLTTLKIPVQLPPGLSNLSAAATEKAWKDSPHALTAIRNSIVHPDPSLRGTHGSAFADAWFLYLWYLEISILRLCDYPGTYANRLDRERWKGQVEKVPWSP